jgi:hypothetical protein
MIPENITYHSLPIAYKVINYPSPYPLSCSPYTCIIINSSLLLLILLFFFGFGIYLGRNRDEIVNYLKGKLYTSSDREFDYLESLRLRGRR